MAISPDADVPKKHIKIWAADPLEKIFRSTPSPAQAQAEVQLEAARGEVVSGQIALRTEGVQQHGFGVDRVAVEALRLASGGGAKPIPVERRWVGYTFVQTPAWGVAPEHLEGQAPGLYPDPLYPVCETRTATHHFNPDHSAALAKDRTQALWLTVRVPRDAKPGVYQGRVRFKISYYDAELPFPVRLTVHPARLPKNPTGGMENWFAPASVVRQHECAWWTPRFWRLLEAYLKNMADHRQTHVVVPIFELLQFRPTRGGLRIGWDRFDRFVEIALRAGFSNLVGSHLATYTYDLRRRLHCGVHTFGVEAGRVRHKLYSALHPASRAWLAWFLPKLRDHLAQRGRLRLWWQHIRDEPGGIAEQYEIIRQAIKIHAPEFRTLDALHGPIIKDCDCWVPQLAAWEQNMAFFRKRQKAGDQVWTYVCCEPTGRYPNRFIDQHTAFSRLLFWLMARHGATGYLHWGYNWVSEPVPETDTSWFLPAQGPVPAGDACIVYPGPNGPHDSIRWEMQREGLQDFELLNQLLKRNPGRARRLFKRIVPGFQRCNPNPKAFRKARRQLLTDLSQ